MKPLNSSWMKWKGGIFGKAVDVPADGLIEGASFNAAGIGQIKIQHDLLAPDKVYIDAARVRQIKTRHDVAVFWP